MSDTPRKVHINFQERVKQMSAKEIIMAMVEGLRKPVTKIDMGTFGRKNKKTGICYGCAATNTICKIAGVDFDSIVSWGSADVRGHAAGKIYDITKLQAEQSFMILFETAIDCLRKSDIVYYNQFANTIDIAKIVIPENFSYDLPVLENNYTLAELEVYEKLANAQH